MCGRTLLKTQVFDDMFLELAAGFAEVLVPLKAEHHFPGEAGIIDGQQLDILIQLIGLGAIFQHKAYHIIVGDHLAMIFRAVGKKLRIERHIERHA